MKYNIETKSDLVTAVISIRSAAPPQSIWLHFVTNTVLFLDESILSPFFIAVTSSRLITVHILKIDAKFWTIIDLERLCCSLGSSVC